MGPDSVPTAPAEASYIPAVRALVLLASLLAACTSYEMTEEQARDPETCAECHPDHYKEWSGSMHAYAAEDPVFLAMNARGQEETDGALGDFCIRCHAPMAVELGETTDGLNLEEVDDALKGVTCYWCHNVEAVTDDHNNPLVMSFNTTMRGGIRDPVDNGQHPAEWSALTDRTEQESAVACGSCHDIVTPNNVALERTFAEWQDTLFADPEHVSALTCSQCHMDGRDGVAAVVEGVPQRRVHSHLFPGVDVALTPFPELEAQAEAVQSALYGTILSGLCVLPVGGQIQVAVTLENIGAGHRWPSGAAQDRRVWVELTAYQGDAVVYSSGNIPAGTPVRSVQDETLWTLGDRLFDDQDDEVHMFWEATRYEADTLAGAVTNDPTDPDFTATHASRAYLLPAPTPDRVTLDVWIRPMGLDVIDDLIASGHLDPSIRDAIPTFALQRETVTWRLDDGRSCTN